jgi:hypothetical protein
LGPTTTSSTLSIRNAVRRDRTQGQPQTLPRTRRFAWLDVLIALCAASGSTASALYQAQFRTSTFAGSDFKTLYASVWCFAHRMDAYSLANLQSVFTANGVIQPERWFGHAPVYPWTTLALLTPFAGIGMVPAAYASIILSGAIMAIATVTLMRYAANTLHLALGWRIAIAGLLVSGPLLSFGLGVGNVSLAASALCFLAFVRRSSGSPWTRNTSKWLAASALALAFLLKPHLALWVGIGMFLLPERAARKVALRAVALVAAFTALTAAALAATGTLALQTHSYLAMLSAETSAGSSMSATSREVLPVVSQITSLESILGFWIANAPIRAALSCTLLLVLGILVVRQTRRVDTERGALLAVVAWCALGMLATYHRASDAAVLLLLVPWVIGRIRRAPLAWPTWAITSLYCAMSFSPDFPAVVRWVAAAPPHSLTAFLLLRQAGLAELLLLLVLLVAIQREHQQSIALPLHEAEPQDLHAAA